MRTLYTNLKNNPRKQLVLLVFLFFLAILGTRIVTMRHGMSLHADEGAFFKSASSVVYPDYSFRQFMNYPGGAFVFQMPFQFFGRIFAQMSGEQNEGDNAEITMQTMQEAGRAASIFYFSVGFLLGAVLLWRNFGRQRRAVILYGLMMLFSIFHIEQSRYGTGDAITFFVLMVILYAIDLFLRENDRFYLYFASFCVGSLMAIKFPLIFFLLYPGAALVLHQRHKDTPKSSLLKPWLLMSLFCVIGLLLFSPQFWIDPTFFMKTFFHEFGSYVIRGNPAFVGSPLNHIVSVLTYQLLYADFPLALPLAIYGCIMRHQNDREHTASSLFYTFVVPAGIVLFLSYNIFARILTMRTLYPYFFLCAFYTAYGAAQLLARPKAKWGIIALTAMMVLRGGYFVYALSPAAPNPSVLEILQSHPKWNERAGTVMLTNRCLSGTDIQDISLRKFMYPSMPFMEKIPSVRPGEFLVSGPERFGDSQKRLVSSGRAEVDRMYPNWEVFRAENAPYLIGTPYPDIYHYLFGSWVLGTSLVHYEFPTNHIYYREYEEEAHADKAAQYNELREATGYAYADYLRGLADIEGCVIIVTQMGDESLETIDMLAAEFTGEENGVTYYGSTLMVMEAGEGVIHYEAPEKMEAVLLEEMVDIAGEVLFKAASNVITIDEREYVFCEPGYHIAVYDRELARVMDWGTLLYSDTGELMLETKYDNRGNYDI